MEFERESNSKFITAASYIALAVVLLGICVLIGWQFDIVLLKSIFPGIVSMNPVTASTFILLSVSLCLWLRDRESKFTQTFVIVTGVVAVIVGTVRMLGIVFGIDLHLDQVLFHEKILKITSFSNNRIAPNTAANFILIGISAILLIKTKAYRAVQALAFVTFMIALLAILGYFYAVKNLYGILSYTPMALNTALAFLSIALVIIFSRPKDGYMKVISDNGLGGTTARWLIPLVIIIPSILGWLRLEGEQRKYYNTEYGSSILVLSVILVFIILVYWLARRIQVVDQARQIARMDLEEANKKLNIRLTETEVQNKSMADTKLATLNLLEDLNSEKQKIALAQAKDEAVLQSIGEGLIETDESGNILRMNMSAEYLLGIKSADALNRPIVEVLKMTDSKTHQTIEIEKRPSAIAINTGKTVTGVYNYFRSDGSSFAASITVTPVKIDDKITGAIEVFHDVTHEVEVDRAKTEFVSLASHQLRTPLTSINWYAEMLLAGDAGKLTEEQKSFVDEIYIGNQRMVDLVNALLNVSRIDLGTFSVEPEMIDLREIGDSLLKEMQPQISAKKMNVSTDYQKDLPQIMADPKLMRIVIQNLMTNAVKYTPESGKVNLHIGVKGDSMQISVADNGYGIPKSQQNKIFSKLFRADNVREKETDGTGLGLYIIKAIVEQSGGKTWFDSEENKGTTFYVTIPLEGMKKKIGTKGLS